MLFYIYWDSSISTGKSTIVPLTRLTFSIDMELEESHSEEFDYMQVPTSSTHDHFRNTYYSAPYAMAGVSRIFTQTLTFYWLFGKISPS